MERKLSQLLCVLLILCELQVFSRSIRISGTPVREDNLEIVVQKSIPLTSYVAEKL